MTQFFQAFPRVSTASDKRWGEKAWVQGYRIATIYMVLWGDISYTRICPPAILCNSDCTYSANQMEYRTAESYYKIILRAAWDVQRHCCITLKVSAYSGS